MPSAARRAVPLLSLILLTAAAPALAANPWQTLGPFGGTVLEVAVDPSNARTVYVTTETEGVFKSLDAGLTWNKVLRDFTFTPGALAVAPKGVVYVSVNPGKVKKSTDAGAHWTLASQGLPDSIVTQLAVDPAQPSRVYAFLPEGGFWRSLDGGASWQPGNAGLLQPRRTTIVERIAAVSKPAGTVYVATNFGIFKSWDGGRSWHELHAGLPQNNDWTVSVAVSPTDPRTVYATLLTSGVYRSTNAGAKWARTAGQPKGVNSLAVSSRSPRWVVAGTGAHGLFRSTDGGEHWAAVGPAGVSYIHTVTAGPTGLLVYAGLQSFGSGEPAGMLASEDGGLSWTRRNHGLAAQQAWNLIMSPSMPGDLWTLSNQGLLGSHDGGGSWQRPPLPDTPYREVGGVAASPLAPTAYVLTLHGVWRTLDDGYSWTQTSGPQVQLANPYLWADPLDSNGLWGTSFSVFYRSSDGGASWSPVPGLAAFAPIAGLAFARSSPRTVYAAGEKPRDPSIAGPTATVYRSEDNGATWTRADAGLDTSGVQQIAVDPVDSRRVYLAALGNSNGKSGVWVTSDGGATWSQAGEELRTERISTVAASAIAGVVWAASRDDGRIFRSGDGGASWEERTADFPATSVNGLTFDPFDPRKLYANTSGGVFMMVDEP